MSFITVDLINVVIASECVNVFSSVIIFVIYICTVYVRFNSSSNLSLLCFIDAVFPFASSNYLRIFARTHQSHFSSFSNHYHLRCTKITRNPPFDMADKQFPIDIVVLEIMEKMYSVVLFGAIWYQPQWWSSVPTIYTWSEKYIKHATGMQFELNSASNLDKKLHFCRNVVTICV